MELVLEKAKEERYSTTRERERETWWLLLCARYREAVKIGKADCSLRVLNGLEVIAGQKGKREGDEKGG